MGTNYYHHASGERTCPHCGQDTPSLHIGKSSVGWCFSLRIHPDEGINDLDDWRAVWAKGGVICNEYGDTVSIEDMESRILDRGEPDKLRTHLGLHTWDCKRGGPTYDLCNYEFS